ncbi:DNA primase [Patescibacteria group bacterium]
MTDATEQIKQKINIVELVGETVKLNKAGTNFKGLCPFHNEKTPSFIVSPDKQIWHCFGCDRGGDIFGYVMEMEGAEFPEALRLLAHQAGVQLPQYNKQASDLKSKLRNLNELAAKYFQAALQKSPGAKKAREYLKERGVDQVTQEHFGLGYAPDSWDSLVKYLISKKYPETLIAEAGLAIKRKPPKPGYLDRFRNRLMFPLRDVHGNVVGFTARQLADDDQMGKYVNTPQTKLYDKSSVLYGLDLGKSEVKRKDYVVLVEGQMDVIASHQFDVENVVATSGTALTEAQINLLKRYTKNIIIAFDMDQAGEGATKRGIDLARAADMNLRVAQLPGSKDPDDLIRTDLQAWKRALKESVSIMDYYFDTTLRDRDIAKVEDKKKIAQGILPQLKRVSDPIEQTHYLQRLSEILNVDENTLRASLANEKTEKPNKQEVSQEESTTNTDPNAYSSAERLLALFIKYPEFAGSAFENIPEQVIEPVWRGFYKILKSLYSTETGSYEKDPSTDLKNIDPAKHQQLEIRCLALEQEMALQSGSENTPNPEQEINWLANKLTEDYWRDILRVIGQKIAQAEKDNAAEELQSLQEKFMKATQKLSEITRKGE